MKKTDIYQTGAVKGFALFAAVVLVLCVISAFLPVHGEEEIYDSVLRLHVIANSDEDADQALKLKVRDAVIEAIRPIADGCASLEEVSLAVADSMEELRLCALNVVRENGCGYDVSVELGREKYPTKTYADVCFPAGEYLSLQIKIGAAVGQNWWCVLFPPLCLESATVKSEMEDNFVSVGLSEDQYKIITDTGRVKYKARFKILELFQSIFD